VSRDDDFYNLLEVSPNATFEEIENAYQRVAGTLGPDSLAVYSMLDEEQIQELRSRLELAYRTLSDPDRRSAYDSRREEAAAYPTVMIPETKSDASVTMGHVPERVVSTPVTPAPPREVPRDVPRPVVVAEPEAEVAVMVAPPAPPVEPRPAAARPAPAARPAAAARPILPAEARDKPRPKKRRFAPPTGFELTSDTEMSGAYLKRLRTACEVSLEELAEITKIGLRHLRALEENEFDALPAAVYVRGFVSEYARVFGLDPELVAKGYLVLYRRYRGGE
jgi:curved DNA-binding protein CbpA